VINVRTDSVIATLDPGQRPRGIRIMPDGRSLVVAVSGSPRGGPGVDESKLPPADRSKDGLAVVDLATRQVRRLPGGIDPENFDISADGKTIYVANEDASAASAVDVASGKVKATIKVGGEPEGVTVRPGGDEVWVTSEAGGKLYVIDTKADTITHVITVGKRPRSVVFTHDGKRAYAPAEVGGTVTVIDATSYRPVATIPVPGTGAKPMGSVISPDDSKVYISTGRGGTVAILATKTNKFIGTVNVGSRPWGLALSDDGKQLWAAGGPPGNDVAVVNLATDQVVNKIPVGKAPWGVAMSK
jgi:YVTN family beta-propeller protein